MLAAVTPDVTWVKFVLPEGDIATVEYFFLEEDGCVYCMRPSSVYASLIIASS